jgi:hypothetical protein
MTGLQQFLMRFISEHRVLEKANACILLDGGDYAEIEDADLRTGIHSLAITRRPAFMPHYPHKL